MALRRTLLLLLLPVLATAQNRPSIGYIYPAGSRQGAELELTVGGNNLAGIATVYVSGEGIETWAFGYRNPENPPSPAIGETITIRTKIAEDATPGPREIRLKTRAGLSNPLVFHVGQLPEFREKEKHAETSTEECTTITMPCVVNGQIMPGDIDRYRVEAKQGQHLVFALKARELIPYLADAVPGWFQAVLSLYDARGHELKFVDDFRFHPDPVLAYEVPEDGAYTIAVHDAIYRGREDFVYRLAVGELPFISDIFPLGGPAGQSTTVDLKGAHLPETRRALSHNETGVHTILARRKHDELAERRLDLLVDGLSDTDVENVLQTESLSNLVPFYVDNLPEGLEQEPNTPLDPQTVTLPIIINGRIDQPGDWDAFCFDGRAGQTIVAEVRARRLGSALDSILRVTDASGKQLAINDDHEDPAEGLVTHHADSLVQVELPSDGRYTVHLGDIQQSGGPAFAYRLRLAPAQPDFALRVVPSSVNVQGGGIVALSVHALRKDGFTGPIDLALIDSPRGFKLQGAQIPAGQNHVRMTLTAPVYRREATVNLSMQGTAECNGLETVRPVAPSEHMMQAFGYKHLVPVSEMKAVVSGRASANTHLTVPGALPVKIPAGGTARIAMRLPGGSTIGQLKFELDDPPKGIEIDDEASPSDTPMLVLKCDAEKVAPDLAGNLIVHAYAVKTDSDGKKPAASARPTPLGMLPAIPFEVVR